MKSVHVWGVVSLAVLLASPGLAAQQPVPSTDGTEPAAVVRPATGLTAPVRLIKFSGVLKDALGQPSAGTLGVTFALYADQEGGPPLWLETQNVQFDEQGRYTVLLGVTQREGLPLKLFSASEARWLEIQVAGEPPQPRILLVSVPYALKAEEAERLAGRKAEEFVLAEELKSPEGREKLGLTVGAEALPGGPEAKARAARYKATANPGPGFISLATSGPPLQVSSTGKVTNLNADLLDSLDSAALQQRVTATCAVGSSIRVINADGTVTCEIDDAGAAVGWSLTGNAGTTAGTNFLGTTDNVALEFKVNGLRALRLEPNATSPNVIGGFGSNSVTGGVAGGTAAGGGASGFPNRVTDDFGTVGGGRDNQAGDNAGTTSDRRFATVGGGNSNTASGVAATVGGGEGNAAIGFWATVAGGNSSTATGDYATVGGGRSHAASGVEATVGGGDGNTASGVDATVGGGQSNEASGSSATVPGGEFNLAQGAVSFAAGKRARALHDGAFVWADFSINTTFDSTAANQFRVRAAGGTEIFSNSGLTAGVTLPAGGSAWLVVSDRASKENFHSVDGKELLTRLDAIPVLTWNWIAQGAEVRHMGPMAQDFHSAFGVGEDEKHISTVDADGVALAAVQALYRLTLEKDKQIVELSRQVEELRAQVKQLAAAQEEQAARSKK